MSISTEKIDAYLMGKLSQTERIEMENELTTNKELAATFAERQKAFALINVIGDTKIKGQLQKIGKAYHDTQQPKAKTRPLWPWMAAAASILLLVIAYFAIPRSQSPQELYAAYYAPAQMDFSSRDQLPETQIAAHQYYEAGQFEAAIPALDQAYQNTQDTKYLLAKGISEMEVGTLEQAKASLLPLVEQQDILYEEQARWYLALAYTQLGQIEAAKEVLQPLVNQPNAFKHGEAQKLSADLEKL